MAYDKRELAESVLNFSPIWPHTVGNMTGTHSICEGMNDDERFGLSFGPFPVRLMKLHLTNHESAELIRMSQSKTGVVF